MIVRGKEYVKEYRDDGRIYYRREEPAEAPARQEQPA
jgi:hypothetical protein